MSSQLFARANPYNIQINETYHYYANISGNPTLEERGEPEGEITVEIPLDGHKYFTRQAYADVRRNYQEISGDLFASVGHLAVSEISPEAFWPDTTEPARRQVLNLTVPIPNEAERLESLIEDRRRVISRHTYRPKWPDVYPRPRPVSLVVNLYDERTLHDRFGKKLDPNEWISIAQELTFERSLFFDFRVELALPATLKFHGLPVLKSMRLEWPVATSYHMLQLITERGNGSEYNLLYVPEKGSVEWQDFAFAPGLYPENEESDGKGATAKYYHAPTMLLRVLEPGELYRKSKLVGRLEVEIPNVLLSDLQPAYYNAAGFLNEKTDLTVTTSLVVDLEINLEQRFNRKILSPHQHLQFEGVMLEPVRMIDISTLLKDLGFRVTTFEGEGPYHKVLEEDNRRIYSLEAQRKEGSDDMSIWIVASGTFAPTERETVIPGGKTFKTTVVSGNMELDLHAELVGNVKKLTQVMNTIHTSLKERFRHVSTIE
jgi:hypothetical protein